MDFCIQSSAFRDKDVIPVRFTCRGEDISPPLSWKNPPTGTQSLALIMEDCGTKPQTRHQWVHWIVYNLPAQCYCLGEGLQATTLPSGARIGLNDWKSPDYGGPCPLDGCHHYRYTLFALDTKLPELEKMTKSELMTAMDPHILASCALSGQFRADV